MSLSAMRNSGLDSVRPLISAFPNAAPKLAQPSMMVAKGLAGAPSPRLAFPRPRYRGQSPSVVMSLQNQFAEHHAPKTSGIIYVSEQGSYHHVGAQNDGNGRGASFPMAVRA